MMLPAGEATQIDTDQLAFLTYVPGMIAAFFVAMDGVCRRHNSFVLPVIKDLMTILIYYYIQTFLSRDWHIGSTRSMIVWSVLFSYVS